MMNNSLRIIRPVASLCSSVSLSQETGTGQQACSQVKVLIDLLSSDRGLPEDVSSSF